MHQKKKSIVSATEKWASRQSNCREAPMKFYLGRPSRQLIISILLCIIASMQEEANMYDFSCLLLEEADSIIIFYMGWRR